MNKPKAAKTVAIQQRLVPPQRFEAAQYEAKVRTLGLAFIGGITLVLALAGLAASFIVPSNSRDLWVILAPMVSTGITTLGFVIGGKRPRA